MEKSFVVSKRFWGLAIAVLAGIAPVFGLTPTDGDSVLIDQITTAVAVLSGAGLNTYGHKVAKEDLKFTVSLQDIADVFGKIRGK